MGGWENGQSRGNSWVVGGRPRGVLGTCGGHRGLESRGQSELLHGVGGWVKTIVDPGQLKATLPRMTRSLTQPFPAAAMTKRTCDAGEHEDFMQKQLQENERKKREAAAKKMKIHIQLGTPGLDPMCELDVDKKATVGDLKKALQDKHATWVRRGGGAHGLCREAAGGLICEHA